MMAKSWFPMFACTITLRMLQL